jgi:dTDP-4-amino-4,6-dideoxygalactose transaminase
MIQVTKSFLPPIEEYMDYLHRIWDKEQLTNHGPLVGELEEKLKQYLNVKHFFYVSNGTIGLQIALRALDIKGDVITTPFSYVATTSAIVWENATPIFVDIDPDSLTIDASKVEDAVTPSTSAILATHVYGIPCDTGVIGELAKVHNLKVIYDAAHAFGVKVGQRPLASFGDVSVLSFHATKLFHTIEGGGIATNDDALAHRISYMRNFGHNGQEDFWGIGINGKNSEFHAAMGLCNFKHIATLIEARRELSELYDSIFKRESTPVTRPLLPAATEYNYSYYPVLFNSEETLLKAKNKLNDISIFPRRYFYPSLTKLPYIQSGSACPVSVSASERILCLPLYPGLNAADVVQICDVISKSCQNSL